MKKSFYAYLSRLKYIKRWGLMRNTSEENVAEHTFNVAIIAHALCVIKNNMFGGDVCEKDVLLAAIYHETAEAITGDLPTPIKYFNKDIACAYKNIEEQAQNTMIEMLPVSMQKNIVPYILGDVSPEAKKIVKAADKLSAYIKCIEEKKSGNTEFDFAADNILKSINALDMQEVNFFTEQFIEGYSLTLDELN